MHCENGMFIVSVLASFGVWLAANPDAKKIITLICLSIEPFY